ncbi:MAG: site-specific integrase [Scytolyngbya sp. HA4215-MV1]|nr:site-specific integrase [Scytolyngbya sp. HA4215-MV1]
MYSKTLTGKASKGSVQVITSHGRLQLRFRFAGKRHYVSLGFPDTSENRKLAEMKAREIELDILAGHFDQTLSKYKPQSSLSVSAPDITPKVTPSLPEIWKRYSETKQSGKSPATIRMYGWVANHLERCPYKLPTEAQAIFDWLNANVPADSTKRVLMHLAACCKWAKKTELLEMVNPFEGMAAEVKVKKAGTEEDEVYPFSREERDRIIQAFKINNYYSRYAPLVEFLFLTGCRPSEALALQWKHINSSTVTFERAVVYNGKGLALKNGLKTQKFRKFPINAQLAALLQTIKPKPCNLEILVFPSPEGKFIDWHNFTNRAWKAVLKSLPEIEYRNPYQTRHTFCSLCREADIASIQIAKWVGNSAQMIDRVYAKPTDHVQVPNL